MKTPARTFYGDLETFATTDLKKAGPFRYAEDPELEILLFPYAVDNGPVQVWEPGIEPMPAELRSCFEDPHTTFVFHNSQFDRTVLDALGYHVPLRRWRDSMVLAYTCGLPGGMEDLGRALGLPEEQAKLKEGKALIQRFCKPAPKNHKAYRYDRTTHPEEWQRFREYATRDVEVMRWIWNALPHWVYQGEELELWFLDQEINERGLPVDPVGVEAAVATASATVKRLDYELEQLTGGAVENGTRVEALRSWISEQGWFLGDMKEATVTWALAGRHPNGPPPPHVHRALEIRQQVAKTSAAKYKTLVRAASSDNRMRGVLQFYGAFRTGRWAGRRFQPQNLPRPSIKQTVAGMESMIRGTTDLLYAESPMEVVSSCIRAAIKPPDGYKLAVGDLANIEGRVLAWLAGESWKIRAFEAYDRGTGPDLYKVAYGNAFGLKPENVDDDQRQIGKVMELALGYQGAVGAFHSMAGNYGVELPDERVVELVKAWRNIHPTIKGFWYKTEEAAIAAVTRPGQVFKAGRALWKCVEHNGYRWLLAKLPSGRFLCYFDPDVRTVEMDYGDKPRLSYMGFHTYTHKWKRLDTYGGKLVENLTQATARDVLAHGLRLAELSSLNPIGHVHDEIIAEVPEAMEGAAERLEAVLCELPPWAGGLPLAAEAKTQQRYAKAA